MDLYRSVEVAEGVRALVALEVFEAEGVDSAFVPRHGLGAQGRLQDARRPLPGLTDPVRAVGGMG
jgi:hypothetical protein